MRTSFSCAAALLLTALGVAANAQTYPNLSITYTNEATEAVTVNGTAVLGGTGSTQAIPIMAVLNSGPGISSAPFTVYCVDLADDQHSGVTQDVSISSITPSNVGSGTTSPPVTGLELSQASYLINKYGNIAGSPGGSTYDTLQGALQLAIWGVISGDGGTNNVNFSSATYSLANQFDGPGNTNLQNFWLSTDADATALTDANTYLKALGSNLGYGTLYTDTDTNHPPTGQNLLGDGVPATPEGSTVALFAFGLAPLFGFKWLAARRRAIS